MASGISNMTLENSIKSQKETPENRIIEVSDQDSNDQDSSDQDSNDQDLEFLKSKFEKLECEIRIIKASNQDANNQDLEFLENEVARLEWEIIKSSFKESEITKKT